jgi:hypothetical protein
MLITKIRTLRLYKVFNIGPRSNIYGLFWSLPEWSTGASLKDRLWSCLMDDVRYARVFVPSKPFQFLTLGPPSKGSDYFPLPTTKKFYIVGYRPSCDGAGANVYLRRLREGLPQAEEAHGTLEDTQVRRCLGTVSTYR